MISSLCVTLQQALLGAFLFLVPAVILSGFDSDVATIRYRQEVLDDCLRNGVE